MSIASEITRLQNAKADLKTSINAKTDSSHQITGETIDEYADFVDSIQTGGGSGGASNPIINYSAYTSRYNGATGKTAAIQLLGPNPAAAIPNDIAFTNTPKKGFVFGFARSNYTLSNNITVLAETNWFTSGTFNQKMFVGWCNDFSQECRLTQEQSVRYELWGIVACGIETPTSANVILNTTTSSNVEIAYYRVNPTNKPCIYFVSSCYNITNPSNASQFDMNFGNIWLSDLGRLTLYVSYNNTPKDIFIPQTETGIIGIEINQ